MTVIKQRRNILGYFYDQKMRMLSLYRFHMDTCNKKGGYQYKNRLFAKETPDPHNVTKIYHPNSSNPKITESPVHTLELRQTTTPNFGLRVHSERNNSVVEPSRRRRNNYFSDEVNKTERGWIVTEI